jgi:hypothetical protein
MMNDVAGTGVVSGNLNNQVLLFRGQGYDFDTTFVDGTEVCAPADPSLYPTFVILAPNGGIATSGVGSDRGGGNWRAHWMVPADADVGEWRVVWTMFSTRQRTYQHELRFTVREANEPLELQQDIPAFVAMEGAAGERVSLLTDLEHPLDLQLSIQETRATRAYSHELLRFPASRMEHERVGVKTLWWTELPAMASGEWLLFWTFRRSPAGPTERVVKELFVPPIIFWELYSALDSFFDRIQKDRHQPFGYYEDDLYRYLKRGMALLNQVNPVTTWQLYTLPRNWGLEDWLIRAAGYWAFEDRTITAGEMQFNLGAQDITLDVERQQFYQQQAQDMFNNIMQYAGKSKREVLRHLRSPARNGLRLGTGVSSTLGGADLLGGVTSPWLRGFSRARRRGGGY